ncbi:CBS domain-containing protein [Saccharopolyspora sp. NFXS83]|uniref:CBS domain-containing protein n=1 Tax=Saccharopolyspora sp. NFXS83 TaxID=2993560 RepID=UPI00224AFEE6|nr:CBS domain-containing protein [Saccharopolyspora sp. NFXS83]MCX2730686.1 CBS domain-containing protein [Saccharopolyspora sp. NFXS83]
MTTARDIMTAQPECVATDDSLVLAAQQMRRLGVGALPICGPDQKVKGVLTDRDIVVRGLGTGKDPGRTNSGSFNDGEAVTIGADDPVDELLNVMIEHQVKRLPVIDGSKLVGMVSIADVARNVPHPDVGKLVEALSMT